MNHTYRLVWNDLINAFVAVSELTKGRGKKTSTIRSHFRAGAVGCGEPANRIAPLDTRIDAVRTSPHPTWLLPLFFAATFAQAADPLPATALPTGAQLAAGQASVAQTGARMDITQSSERAILNWQSFNIGQSAHVNFNQPSASAVTLNRVVGGDPSQILGRITANGQVFLSNPNGIYFGKNAQIDVAGLVATTHNIRDQDFMAGRNDFTIPGKPGASVINEGNIRIADTGIAAFVAPSVANRGVIAAKLGKIQLAAANAFTLDFHGDDLLTFLVDDKVAQTALDQNGQPLASFVESSGRIEAEGGYVWLTAKAAEGAVHSAINHSGVVEANRVDNQGGVIVLSGGEHGLVTVSGKLDASGQGNAGKGGEITVTGETVHLVSNATLDASGQEGGGTILVGGDHMGGNLGAAVAEKYGLHLEKRPIPNAKNVLVEEGVVLNASALERGDGGKVVIWADEATEFRGDIFARGGATAGNGGIVEISGGKRVLALGTTDVSAPSGKKGYRLIDPAGSLYSTTADFFAELDDTAVARIVDMHQDTDNALYVLSVKKKASSEFRVDPDGTKAYLADIILTKIQNGVIVAQTLIDTLFATYGTETNGGPRGALQVQGNEVTVFFNEKTVTSSNYGQNGYRYRLSKTTLDSTTSKETLFTSANWGWYPYFDDSGNVLHFSFAGYYAMSNTNTGAFIWPNDFAKLTFAARLANGDITGDVNTLTWDLLSESLLSQAQQIVQISDSGNPINDNNNPIDVDTPDIPDDTSPDLSNQGRPGDVEADPEHPPTTHVELCKAGDIVCAGGIRIVPGIDKPDESEPDLSNPYADAVSDPNDIITNSINKETGSDSINPPPFPTKGLASNLISLASAFISHDSPLLKLKISDLVKHLQELKLEADYLDELLQKPTDNIAIFELFAETELELHIATNNKVNTIGELRDALAKESNSGLLLKLKKIGEFLQLAEAVYDTGEMYYKYYNGDLKLDDIETYWLGFPPALAGLSTTTLAAKFTPTIAKWASASSAVGVLSYVGVGVAGTRLLSELGQFMNNVDISEVTRQQAGYAVHQVGNLDKIMAILYDRAANGNPMSNTEIVSLVGHTIAVANKTMVESTEFLERHALAEVIGGNRAATKAALEQIKSAQEVVSQYYTIDAFKKASEAGRSVYAAKKISSFF